MPFDFLRQGRCASLAEPLQAIFCCRRHAVSSRLSTFSLPTPALIDVPVLNQHIVGDGEGAPHLKGTLPEAALEGPPADPKPRSADGGLAIASIAEGQEREVLKVKSGREVVPCVHRGHDSVPRARRLGPGQGEARNVPGAPSGVRGDGDGGDGWPDPVPALISYTQRVAHRCPA